MAVRRPGGPLPLGNKPPGFTMPRRPPGAGARSPTEPIGGPPRPGVLPTFQGRSGRKPFESGRTSIKRSFQLLSDRRITPFFNPTPTGEQSPDFGPLTDKTVAEEFGLDAPSASGDQLRQPAGRRRKVRLSTAEKKRILLQFKKGAV